MSESGAKFLTRIHDILQFPIFQLGDQPVTLFIIVVFILIVALVFGVESILRRYLLRRLLSRTHFDAPLQFAIGKIVGYVFILLGFYIALQVVGINLTSLAVVAGAVGLGIGFGLQNIIHNFVSGLIILAERPIAIGDRIEVGGVAGQVKQIRLRSTTVVTNDNITIIVPNSEFISHSVTNWSYGDATVRLRLPVGVAYGTDVRLVEKLLVEAALEHDKALRDPAPSVFFIGFGESALEFELGVWTREMAFQPRRFKSDLFFIIEKKLRENKIVIPFPQRDLHLRSGKFPLPSNEKPNVAS